MAKFITLCSGSSGNAALVEEAGRCLLIDAGLGYRACLSAFQQIGVSANSISGILITHEHTDHIKGLRVLLKHLPAPLVASAATLDELWVSDLVPPDAQMIAADEDIIELEGFTVTGFPTSHDAAGCHGFRVATPSGSTMALATDLGVITDDVFLNLVDAHLVALESNYDKEMLRLGPYPAYLKKRILSSRGHLCNRDAAAAATALIAGGCRHVVLCHLSQENNQPELALAAVDESLAQAGISLSPHCTVRVAPRHHPGEWIEF